MKDRLCMWIAWKLPRRLVKWTAVRLMSMATMGKYENTEAPRLTCMDALQRWCMVAMLCLLFTGPVYTQVSAPLVHTNNNVIALAWDANTEIDLGGYEVWRSPNSTFAVVGGVGPVKVPLGKVTTYSWPLVIDGTYWFTVVAKDLTGNLSGFSNILNFKVDTVLPVISGTTITSITTTGAMVTWTTNELADTQVESGTTTAYGRLSVLKPAPALVHLEVLTGLLPSTLYNLRVKSADAAGNLANSANLTFTTLPPDVTPPAPPTGLNRSIATNLTPTTGTIAWKTDEDASGFVALFKDGGGSMVVFEANEAIRTNDHVVVLTGLLPNTFYRYQAVSRNAASVEIFSSGGSFVTKGP